MIKKIFKYISLCAIALPVMLTSCMDDDLGANHKGVQHCKISVNIKTDLATTHTRAVDMTPGAIVNLNSIWIGVYDVATGEKLNDDDIIVDMGYLQTATGSKFMDAIEVEFDQNATSQVCVVGVANFENVYGDNGVSLESQLRAANTWADFSKIYVDTESAYEGLHGTTTPLLMGYLLKEDDSPLAQINQFAGFGSVSLDHPRATTDIFFRPNDYDLNDNGKININDRYLRLRKLVSQINVNVGEGEGITISNLQFKKMNMPKKVYLAERKTDVDNEANNTTLAENLSPNKADIKPNEYYTSDEEWNIANVGQYGFTFQQFENKHWGASATNYQMRGKKNPDGTFAMLGDDKSNPNVYASYFIMSMSVVDHNQGITADVEYIVPEGYCSDNEGNPLYDGKNITSNDIYKDFNCFRNTDYTYTIKVNGIDDIIVNVTSDNGTHNDDQSGKLWQIKYPNNVSRTDLISINGETYNNFIEIESDPNPANGGEGLCFRLSGYDEDNKPIDIFYNAPNEFSTHFNSVWPAISMYNTYYDIKEADIIEVPQNLLDAFTIVYPDGTRKNVVEFVQENPGPGKYGVIVANNQGEAGDRGLYIANRKDLLEGKYDNDGCTGEHILYATVQMGTHVNLAKPEMELCYGTGSIASESNSATVTPAAATNKTVTWSSSNPSVATVDASGNVTRVSPGVAIITASCGKASSSFPVTVRSMSLPTGVINVLAGDPTQIVPSFNPELNFYYDNVTWRTSTGTIDANGFVTVNGTAQATVTATYRNQISATCTVLPQRMSITGPATIRRGNVTAEYTVTIPACAQSHSLMVTIKKNSFEMLNVDSIGEEVVLPNGNRQVTFKVYTGSTTSATGSVTMTIAYGGASLDQVVTIN